MAIASSMETKAKESIYNKRTNAKNEMLKYEWFWSWIDSKKIWSQAAPVSWPEIHFAGPGSEPRTRLCAKAKTSHLKLLNGVNGRIRVCRYFVLSDWNLYRVLCDKYEELVIHIKGDAIQILGLMDGRFIIMIRRDAAAVPSYRTAGH